MESLYAQYQAASIRRYFKTRRTAKIATATIFLAVLALVAIGIYFFFRGGFLFIYKDQFLRSIVALYAYELFFLMIAILMFTSALISALFGLFHNESFEWIMVTPQYRLAPFYILSRTLEMSLWPLVLIGVPALCAIRAVFGLSIVGFFISLASILVLGIFCVVLAVVVLEFIGAVLWLLGMLVHRRTVSTGSMVLCILILACITALVFRTYAPIDFALLSQVSNLSATTADLRGVIQQFSVLPTHYPALALQQMQSHDGIGGFSTVLPLVVQTLILILIFLTLSHFWYLRIWQALKEGTFVAEADEPKRRKRPSRFPRFATNPDGVLFEKEALMLYRNTKSTLWFGFMLFLWLLQIILNLSFRNNSVHASVDQAAIPLAFQAFQIVIMIYFVSAFTLRFGFPALSAEKRTLWILGSSPIDLVRVFWAKVLFYTVIFTGIGSVIGFVNATILSIPIMQSTLFMFLAIVALATISCLGVSLGALFPNFETDDPEVLSTSLPGLGFISGSLSYGALGAIAYYFVLAYHSWLLVALFTVISAAVLIVVPQLAARAIPKIEFSALRE